MAAPSITPRLVSIAWCVLVPLGVVIGYLALGIAVVSAVGEPILGTVVLGGIVTVLVGAARIWRPRWFAHRPGRRPMAETPRFAWAVTGCLALAFLAGQSLALWLYVMGGSTVFDESNQARHAAGPVAALVLALIVAPVAEEMLFRGVLYPLLRRRVGVVASMLVTSAVFGLLHGNVVQFASALPLAVLLALVYERMRVLWPCALIHLGFNTAATLTPAPVLAGLANPVSALLLTTAFLGCAYELYQRVAAAAPTVSVAFGGGGEGEEEEPQAA